MKTTGEYWIGINFTRVGMKFLDLNLIRKIMSLGILKKW